MIPADEPIGQSIKVFLVEGTPSGLVSVEIMNWTGKVLAAPGGKLPLLLARDEAARTGVYVLQIANPDDDARPAIYIGESDEVRARIARHIYEEKFEIVRACVVVSSDANLTKDHVRWLESRLLRAAKEAHAASPKNATDPGFAKLPESDRAMMAGFFAYLSLVLPLIGFDYFRPPVRQPGAVKSPSTPVLAKTFGSPVFEFAVGAPPGRASAQAAEVDGRLVVLRGSTARRHGPPSWSSFKRLRAQLEADGRLVPAAQHGDLLLEFAEDVAFDSPSAAAVAVAARNENGREVWRDPATGRSYWDWKTAQVANAAPAQDVQPLAAAEGAQAGERRIPEGFAA